jgi:taurine--2-oxoglutarate transaminase
MSGWGRTGKWFAVDHWDVKPDILTTAKGITSAYVPLGLCVTTSEVAEYFEDHYFAHGHTYEAHPLTIAAAVAAIGEYQRLNLIDRAVEMGLYMEQKLRTLQEKHRCVGDVRGIGLFWTVDLAKDSATKAPYNTFKDKTANVPLVVDRIAAEMMKNGVFIQAWVNHFIIAPPLIISREEIDQGVAALDAALEIADNS